jgi:uncharacterized protein (TIGR04141 family)
VRLNIFSIRNDDLPELRKKLASLGMPIIHSEDQQGWHGEFYFSNEPSPGEVDWAETFSAYFDSVGKPQNISYFAVYLFTKGNKTYAVSYGKSHFYLRQFCDHDFGVEVAKRIANENDIRQTSSKRFAGKRRKDIKSFTADTKLDVESGESVDYLQAAILAAHQEIFGKTGKFGSSAQFTIDLIASEIGSLLEQLSEVMKTPALFKLPRTTIVTEQADIAKYDGMLVDELLSNARSSDFTDNSYDLYGVDFVFSNDGTYRVWCPKYEGELKLDQLTIDDLLGFIESNSIDRADILGIKVAYSQGSRQKYTKKIKELLDYIAGEEYVVLSGGKWMRFNQDYLDFLDESLEGIAVEYPEEGLEEITIIEKDFNDSEILRELGYKNADRDFSKIKLGNGTPVEAWDLEHHEKETVYAVKFGPAQKLGYVCDQALTTLELIRNGTVRKSKLPHFKRYGLWLGYEAVKKPDSITKTGSLILKQKIESWARKCRELGVEPVIKISRKTKV